MNTLSINNVIGGLVIIGGLYFAPVMAAEAEKTAQQQCAEYAKEDGVTAEQMETYIAECVASLTEGENSPHEGGKTE